MEKGVDLASFARWGFHASYLITARVPPDMAVSQCRSLMLDMSGVPRQAKPAVECPLDGWVRSHSTSTSEIDSSKSLSACS